MKKFLLFNLSLLMVVGLSAQTFQLMDDNDVDISGTTHYEYGNATDLGLTKLHVKNLTGTTQAFGVRVTLEYSPYTLSDLAVCFGVACYSASATVNTTQIINSGNGDNVAGSAIYTDLKVAPVTWPWVNPATDSCIWRVTVFDSANPTDSSSALVIYRDNSTTSIDEFNSENVKLSAYPNPVSNNNVNISYSLNSNVEAELVMYDLVGKEINTYSLKGIKDNFKMDISDLNSGVYFYSLRVNGKAIKTERLIVK